MIVTTEIHRRLARRGPDLGDVLMAAPFALWGAATLALQFDRGHRFIRALDPTGLIVPDWRFFAPRPASHEYHLLYRDARPDGTMSGWNEVDLGADRRLRHIVWAPHRRLEKGLFDATTELMRVITDMRDPAVVRMSAAYLALLTVVTHSVSHQDGAVRTQFMLVRAAAHEPDVIPSIDYISDWHRLEGEH
ncbi:hypothetical protein M3D91_009770 [Micrococcus luteus]|nr:hypothetical protein [Micrococcus luteus]